MDRYLPIAAALLALPHLLSIAASGGPAAAAARTPRAVSAPAAASFATAAHCALALPRAQSAVRAPSRAGVVASLAQQPYLQR